MTINWVGWLLSAIMLLLLFGMVMALKSPVRLLFTGKTTKGAVAGVIKSKDGLLAPSVQFVAYNGTKVTVNSRNYTQTCALKVGDPVTVMYNPADPADAELLLWREFIMAGILLGFIIFVLLIWLTGMIMDPSDAPDDPLHILSRIVAHFRLSPLGFPMYFILTGAILSSGLGAYFNFKSSFDLRANGVKVAGLVTGTASAAARSQGGNLTTSGKFAIISYMDSSGNKYNTRRSAVNFLAGLHEGDTVEVIYPPAHPAWGVVNTWDEIYFLPTFFAFMFVGFAVSFVYALNGYMR